VGSGKSPEKVGSGKSPRLVGANAKMVGGLKNGLGVKSSKSFWGSRKKVRGWGKNVSREGGKIRRKSVGRGNIGKKRFGVKIGPKGWGSREKVGGKIVGKMSKGLDREKN